MKSCKIAYLEDHGKHIIAVPVNDNFPNQSDEERNYFIQQIMITAHSAGLDGEVGVIWTTGFMAPESWHSFFENTSFDKILASCNQTLTW